MAQDIQNALKFPGDHLTKIWKVILNMLGIDFDKLPPDEQKVLKKVLAKTPVIKNNPLNFRRRRKKKLPLMELRFLQRQRLYSLTYSISILKSPLS